MACREAAQGITNIAMWSSIPIAALLLQAAGSQPQLASSSRDVESVTDAAGFAVMRFLSGWRTAWLQSVGSAGDNNNYIRLRDVHCHWDGSYGVRGFGGYGSGSRGGPAPPNVIHRSSRRSMCPDWYPTGEGKPDDERIQRDAALRPSERNYIRGWRSMLLDSLAYFDEKRPGDAWITGQRVRFLIDQGNVQAAVGVARACAAKDKAWCAQLAGYAYNAAGDYRRADSAYDAATALMPHDKKCEWTSAEMLFDNDSRGDYKHLSCEERTAANERLWWLTTPLFSDSVDDRRSEDFSRKVMLELHSALPWDERYDYRGNHGGQAVEEMMTRYGWPAYSSFAGAWEERDHAGWMNFYDSTRTATAEYPQDRLHLIPKWAAVAEPFKASADNWQINMPTITDDDEPAAQWWPAEHYARDGGWIVQLPDQTVMLRRDHDVLLATASQLSGPAEKLRNRSAAGVLVRSTEPHKVEKLAHQTFVNKDAIVITGHLPVMPAVIGTEIVGEHKGDISARTRFGVTPPAPLSALKPGEAAISDPVLIASDDAPPTSPEQAIERMLGAPRVRAAKLGVYWETYGFAPEDSVDVAVVITRKEPIGKMRRLGMLLRLAQNPNGSVAMRWKEPQTGRNTWLIPGVVPIQARSIQLDLTQIEPGHYAVQALVGRRGAIPITSSRDFLFEGVPR